MKEAPWYRCQFCGAESPAGNWRAKRVNGNEACPKCGEPYDERAAILAQESEE